MPTWGENASGAIFRPGSMMSIPECEFRGRVPARKRRRVRFLARLARESDHFPVAALARLESAPGRSTGQNVRLSGGRRDQPVRQTGTASETDGD